MKTPVPLEARNHSECKLLSSVFFLLSLERKIARWPGSCSCSCLCMMGPDCAHRHTQEDRSAGRGDTGCREVQCLPEVLRGSSISFCSNALFVDKSKLMIVKREAFGGKILLTLLRLNLTTEQDTSSCRNDRLL